MLGKAGPSPPLARFQRSRENVACATQEFPGRGRTWGQGAGEKGPALCSHTRFSPCRGPPGTTRCSVCLTVEDSKPQQACDLTKVTPPALAHLIPEQALPSCPAVTVGSRELLLRVTADGEDAGTPSLPSRPGDPPGVSGPAAARGRLRRPPAPGSARVAASLPGGLSAWLRASSRGQWAS